MGETMTIKSDLVDDIAILSIKGSFDIASYREFNQAYARYLGSVNQFRVDLAQATRMDSSALGMLLLLRELAGVGSKIELVNVEGHIANTLKTAQFNQLFTIK